MLAYITEWRMLHPVLLPFDNEYTAQTDHHKSMFNTPVSSPEIKSWPRDCHLSIFPRVPRYFQTTAKFIPTNEQRPRSTTLPVTALTLIVIRSSDISKLQLLETCRVVNMFKHSLKHTHNMCVCIWIYITIVGLICLWSEGKRTYLVLPLWNRMVSSNIGGRFYFHGSPRRAASCHSSLPLCISMTKGN
jgi:hypothetical protein